MSLYVERKLMVADQEMNAVITRADHVSLSGALTVRGIIYNVHAHYTRQNGQWAFHNAPDDRSVSISGAYSNDKRNWNKRPAPTVRDFIVSSMVTALNDFVQDNGQLFKEAEAGRLDHEIEGGREDRQNGAGAAPGQGSPPEGDRGALSEECGQSIREGHVEHGSTRRSLRFCQEQHERLPGRPGRGAPAHLSEHGGNPLARQAREGHQSITEGRAGDRAQTPGQRQADQPRTHPSSFSRRHNMAVDIHDRDQAIAEIKAALKRRSKIP
jgi:hypothetical protein